jgi:hypothetical protein
VRPPSDRLVSRLAVAARPGRPLVRITVSPRWAQILVAAGAQRPPAHGTVVVPTSGTDQAVDDASLGEPSLLPGKPPSPVLLGRPPNGRGPHRLRTRQRLGWIAPFAAVTAVAAAIAASAAVGGAIHVGEPAVPQVVVSLTPTPTPTPTSVVVTVPASGGWIDTGIQLNVGDSLHVTAIGSWTADSVNYAGPDGYRTESADNFFNVQDIGTCADCATTMAPHWGALISYTGASPPATGSYTSTGVASDTRLIALVGSNFTGSSPRSGELWLGFNDDAYSGNTQDNSGHVTATITVTTR